MKNQNEINTRWLCQKLIQIERYDSSNIFDNTVKKKYIFDNNIIQSSKFFPCISKK